MKAILSALLCLLSSSLLGAQGDQLATWIGNEGRDLFVKIEKLNTNGMFFPGFVSTNMLSQSSNAVVLTVTGPGYNADGTTNISSRTVWATKHHQAPYPSHTIGDFSMADAGANVIIRLSLSGWIATNETVTGTALSGYYAVTNTSPWTNANAFTAITITNRSVLPWSAFRVIPAIFSPDHQLLQNDIDSKVRFGGAQSLGQDSMPIRGAKVTWNDGNGNVIVKTVNTWDKPDVLLGDAVPGSEMSAYCSIQNMTNLAIVRTDIFMYPWYGDTNATFDTSKNTYTGLDPRPQGQTNLCDRLQRKKIFAVLATNGVTAGVVITNSLDTNSPPTAFLTPSGAANAIRGTNNFAFGDNSVTAGIIYVRPGEYPWTGGSGTYGANPNCFLKFVPYPTNGPGYTWSLTNYQAGTDQSLGNRLWIKGCNVILTNSITIRFPDEVVFEECKIDADNGNVTSYCFDVGLQSFYRCLIIGANQGIKSYSIQPGAVKIVRGCTFRWNLLKNPGIVTHVLMDCLFDTTNRFTGGLFAPEVGSMTQPYPGAGPCWVYNNNWLKLHSTDGYAIYMGQNSNLTDVVIANNNFEWIGGPGAEQRAVWWLAADDTTVNCTNVILAYNTTSGQRLNCFYNSIGSAPFWKINISEIGNIFENRPTKGPTFGNPADGNVGNAGRIGSLGWLYSVGCYDNALGSITNRGTANFAKSDNGNGNNNNNGFAGINGIESINGSVHPTNYFGFVDPRSSGQDYADPSKGGGDYRLKPNSPLILPSAHKALFPYTLDGYPRTIRTGPGAFGGGTLSSTFF